MWSPDGAEIVFSPGPSNQLHAVRVTTQPSFTFGEAIPVEYSFEMAAPRFERPYDISRDGQHFLGLIDAAQGGGAATEQIHVVLNWFEELKRLVPVN